MKKKITLIPMKTTQVLIKIIKLFKFSGFLFRISDAMMKSLAEKFRQATQQRDEHFMRVQTAVEERLVRKPVITDAKVILRERKYT